MASYPDSIYKREEEIAVLAEGKGFSSIMD
jgi:hypothetical protein